MSAGTVGDLKKILDNLDDNTPLRIAAVIESGERGETYDNDCEWSVEVAEDTVVINVNGEEDSE